jgi:hypothetical protein
MITTLHDPSKFVRLLFVDPGTVAAKTRAAATASRRNIALIIDFLRKAAWT